MALVAVDKRANTTPDCYPTGSTRVAPPKSPEHYIALRAYFTPEG